MKSSILQVKFWYAMALTLLVLGCMENYREVSYPSEDEVVEEGSLMESHLIQTVLLDGSEDNILDNASCLSVVYPVQAYLNDELFRLESSADLELFEVEYLEKITHRNQFKLVYPIEVLDPHYQLIKVYTLDQLNELANGCIEGGQDEDFECLDFVYPIEILSYNPVYQSSNANQLIADQEFYHYLINRNSDELISVNYPVSFSDLSGGLHEIESNEGLINLIDQYKSECDEKDEKFTSDIHGEMVMLRIIITDAPYPVELIESASIQLKDLYARYDNDEAMLLSAVEQTVNIFQLRNGITDTLVETEVPIGIINRLNIIVSSAEITLKDGRSFDLDVPSGSKSGIKVDISPVIELHSESTNEVLLDFDLSQSFVPVGNDNSPNGIQGFNFKPKIKATNLEEAGDLFGVVKDAESGEVLNNVQVSIYDASNTLYMTTFTEASGNYMMLGLLPGSYSVKVEKDGYADRVQSVEIILQSSTELNFTIDKE